MILPYSALFSCFLLLLIAVLGLRVSALRINNRISYGDGENRVLHAAIRAHANAIEHSTPVMIVLWMYESMMEQPTWTLVMGLIFCLARLSHAIGMSAKVFFMRRWGAALTYAIEFFLPIAFIVQALIR